MGDSTIKTQSQLEDILNDPQKIKESLSKAMSEGVREGLSDTVRDAVSEELNKRDRQTKLTTRLPGGGSAYNPSAPGVSLDGKFESFGKFLQIAHAERSNFLNEPRLKALNENAGGEGGFLVPEEFRANLMMMALQQGFIRPRATVLPMPRGNLKFPVIRDTTHVSSVFGGVIAYWESEAGNIANNASQPTFAQVGLVAKKLTGYTVAGNELLNDSAIALEALLMSLFPEAIRYYEEEAFVNGNGAGQPLGILNSGCTITQTAETSQAAGTVVYENVVKMYARMLPSSVNRAIWLYNPAVFPQLATMALSVGTGGSAVWISNVGGNGYGGAANTPPATILGRPAFPSEHCQALGTAGDIMLVDPAYYVIGDTQELSIASSMHVNFTSDQIVWRFIERLDGRPWLDSALTPKYGTNSVSPFIVLASR